MEFEKLKVKLQSLPEGRKTTCGSRNQYSTVIHYGLIICNSGSILCVHSRMKKKLKRL